MRVVDDSVTTIGQASCLSFAEETVWQLDRLRGAEEDGLFGRMSTAFRLTGRLDIDAMTRAAVEVVRRHAVLRTSYCESPRGVERHVHPVEAFHAIVEPIDAADPHAAVAARMADEITRPFDLHAGPLWRFRIDRASDTDHYVQLTVHHIVSDAWSGAIILRDLGALYNRFSGGLGAELPPLPLQYADYAVRERTALDAPRFDALRDYWHRQLADAPDRLDLPTDAPRREQGSRKSATVGFTLPGACGRAVAAVASRERTTPFVFLLSIFKTLLHKLSGQTTIVVGTPMANRDRKELENVVGLFLDILALRTDMSGDEPFTDVLRRVRDTLFGAVRHADMPIGFLGHTLNLLPTNGGRPPFFPVVFNFRNSGLLRGGSHRSPFIAALRSDPRILERMRRAGPLRLRGIEVERIPTGIQNTSEFDVTLNVNPLAFDETRFEVIYDASLFSAERMRSFCDQYAALVHHALADPQARIATYPLVTD